MLKRNQYGGIATTLLLFSLLLLLCFAIGFGAWAFSGRQTYKNNVDSIVARNVASAKQQQSAADAIQYAEEAKQPLRAYNGPEAYGSIIVNFPKDWSAYVDGTGTGAALVDGYFAPGTVPAINAQGSVFALRVQVVNQPYSQVLQNVQGQQQGGQVTSVVAYAIPKVPKVVGVEITGSLGNNRTGTMVLLPLRSDTLEISTDGTQYLGDFKNNILPNFSFSP